MPNKSKTRKVVVLRKKFIDESGRIVNSNRIEDDDQSTNISLKKNVSLNTPALIQQAKHQASPSRIIHERDSETTP